MPTELENAEEGLRKAQAKAQAAHQAVAKVEHDKQAVDKEAKAALEQANLDASKYINTIEMVDKITAAIGKRIISPADAIVVTYLMLTSRDALGQATPQAGINAIASFFRGYDQLKKKDGK